jgi:hypothetical protein
VALRTQNLSVYDIQRNLAAAGHAISITALSLLLRAEGFARLPRRPDDQRPPTTKPEPGAPADVRLVNLTPRSFDTQVGGLFLFVPLMRDLRLTEVLGQADLPGSVRIPAAQAVRTLLALKLLGKERKSHVMDLVADQGIALFAGLTRTYRTPKVLEERIRLRGYDGELRQVTVVDLGHEEPTILLTNNEDITFVALVTRYAQRMLIENGIAEAIHFCGSLGIPQRQIGSNSGNHHRPRIVTANPHRFSRRHRPGPASALGIVSLPGPARATHHSR